MVAWFKAHLQPCDDITVVFDVSEGASAQSTKMLSDVIRKHKDYIEDNIKQPLIASALSPLLTEIISERAEVPSCICSYIVNTAPPLPCQHNIPAFYNDIT